MIAKSHRWQLSALAAAATALIGLSPAPASALSLGAVVVQSALGEPLRAEIDIPEINADEAASLKASIASPEAFRAAGLEYNAAMANAKVTLQRRANGRAFIRLVSDRPVNEPFVDMILEASWASGRIVRDYTMLFDPPNLRAPAVANTESLAQVAPSAAATSAAPGVTPRAASAPATASGPAAAVPRTAVATPKAVAKPAAKAAASSAPAPDAAASDKQVTVKAGDTAGKIAMANKSASVSLDQMLVALLRANPNAFINSNINRVKSGAVMNLPTPEQAQSTPASEAHQIVVAQSKDFGEYSKKLAGAAPSAQVGVADRQASGSVQTKVEDKKPASGAPDKLTLSKGALQAQAAAEKLAAEKAAKDSATRTAEVSKNIKDLADINAASAKPGAVGATGATATAAATPSPATGVAKPAAPVAPPAPPAPVAVPTPPVVVAAPPAPPPAPAKPASAPVVPPVASVASAAKPAAKPVVATAPVPAEPGLIDQLTENPLVLAGGAGLIALLAGFGLYRVNQRKKSDQVDSSYLESRLQPDSFFGASGGQRVDTQDSAVGGASSMVYTPSQLDAADDVDPVAEADVYLAYGRDVQAEEILKEALKFNPGRVAIHQKLLEIYAKRRDVKSFENAAKEAFKPTGGTGADWHRICDLGLSIDPNNPLYSPGGQPSGYSESTQTSTGMTGAGALAAGATAAGALSSFATTTSFDAATAPMSAHLDGAVQPVDVNFDLDLDFSLDEENASLMQSLGTGETTSKMQALNTGSAPLDVNFDVPELSHGATVPAPMAAIPRMEPLDFDMSVAGELSNSGEISRPAPLEGEDFRKQAAVSFGTTIAGTVETFAPKAPEPAAPASGFMQFDLGGLSLDLGDPAEKTVIIPPAPPEDPLATKLSLAEEFSTIGDDDGARALIEEVILEATGEMKARAQLALAKLS